MERDRHIDPANYYAPTHCEGSRPMRGADEQPGSMFSYISLEERVPQEPWASGWMRRCGRPPRLF